MNVLFEKKFLKNINTIENKEIKLRTQQIIIEVENATSFNQISNIKKLKGHKYAYRILIGEYRIGFFFENKNVIFTCIYHRKDIYRFLP